MTAVYAFRNKRGTPTKYHCPDCNTPMPYVRNREGTTGRCKHCVSAYIARRRKEIA